MKETLVAGALALSLAACVGEESTVAEPVADATTATDTGKVDAPVDTGKSDAPVLDSAGDDAGLNLDAADASLLGHAYVTNFQSQTGIVVFALPLTNASVPITTLKNGLSGPTDVEIAGNQLLVLDRGSSKVMLFDFPITFASLPKVSFSIDFTADDSALDANGNLWVSGLGGIIEKFDAPLSNASVKSLTLMVPTGNCFGITFDGSGNLYAGSYNSGGIYMYKPPFTVSSTPSINVLAPSGPTGLVASGTKLYASDFKSGQILAVNLPLTADAGGSAVGKNVTSPERLAFIGADLGLADHTTGVHIFAAPAFTTELVNIPNSLDSGLGDPRGIVFGP